MRKLIVGSALLVSALAPAGAPAHGGNPNYRSEFRSVRPAVPGLHVEVLNYDDRLLLINRTGKTVLVRGYEREPYARLKGDGTVEVNRNSPSFYLNQERYGGTQVSPTAGPRKPPDWVLVGKTSRFETHDHRIHWMSKEAIPPRVSDKDKRTRVFDWRVPVEVGSERAAITGSLFWTPSSGGGIPSAAIVALTVLIVVSAVLFIATRRVRRKAAM
jgi:hypothetical protein